MQQLLLDVFTPPRPHLGNFLVGQNAQMMHTLHQMEQGRPAFCAVYLHGTSGCGKTHLLKGLAQALQGHYLTGTDRFVFKPDMDTLIMDDVHLLTPYSQVQLFNAFNSHLSGEKPHKIILAGQTHPATLKLREDLRTRIESGLCFRVHPLSDDDKHAALQATAQSRGLQLSEEVIDYALRYFQRDMGSLMAVLDSLDRFSLEQHKPVSVHLLRHWMKRRESLVVREH